MQRKQIYIADSNHGTILLSDFEKEVISTKLFNRLHHISQNSTAYLTFPSNRTKRFEHSIGTMKLCGDLFYSAMCNSDKDIVDSIFSNLKDLIIDEIVENNILKEADKYRRILGDSSLKNNGKILKDFNNYTRDNIFYNRFIPKNVPDNYKLLYVITFQAIRLCALLHDLGHPPFSHVTESSINSIYESLKDKDNLTHREKEFLDIIASYDLGDDKFQLHEIMGKKMTEKLFSQLIFSEDGYLYNKDFEEKYFVILVAGLTKLIYSDREDLRFLYSIISGIIDGDRLDYVSRDIQNSGIDNGKIEYDRLIASAKFIEDNRDGKVHILMSFDSKTINTIEDFFLKRWYLYKNVIYHHRVAKTDTLLEKSVYSIIRDYLSNDDEEPNLNSNILPDDISGLWKAIRFAHSNDEYFDFLIQWDDNWLITILKKEFFENYYGENTEVSYMLEEFLSNKKNYYSIIKSSNDFNMFMKELDEKIDIESIEDEFLYKKIKEHTNDKYSKLNALLKYLRYGQEKEVDFTEYIDSFISEKYRDVFDKYFVVKKRANTGLKKMPILYTYNGTIALTLISNLISILTLEQNNYPKFYLYVKPIHGKEISNEFRNKFLLELASYIASKLNEIKKFKE